MQHLHMKTMIHKVRHMYPNRHTKTESWETHKHKYMHKLNYKYTQGDTHRQKYLDRELLILMYLLYTKIDWEKQTDRQKNKDIHMFKQYTQWTQHI